ncbi:MAG TPA: KEOPS complex kinase/ATPase Bud32 [Thermoproteota archaeon]|nr:KEOPS complex kinase/ATPase Bud32 [Thermoproteota archaeon]
MRSDFPEGFEPERALYSGAESKIWLGTWMGRRVVLKHRLPKAYRNEELDEGLRVSRTVGEALSLHECKLAGVRAPYIYHVNPKTGTILMSYVEGPTLTERLRKGDSSWVRPAGSSVGKLHAQGISHGDLTPSNLLVSRDEVVLLDFGLSERTNDIEKFAEDLNVMMGALRSLVGERWGPLWREFESGYLEEGSPKCRETVERLKLIMSRGRYRRREDRRSR